MSFNDGMGVFAVAADRSKLGRTDFTGAGRKAFNREVTMRLRTLLSSVALTTILAAGAAGTASAETNIVKLAQQFGLLYVPLHVVLEQDLVTKHTKKMGLGAPNKCHLPEW